MQKTFVISTGKITMTAKRAALYVRVSTDQQTTENQVRELTAIAERNGWRIVEVYDDAGISGAKGRDKRPGLNRMLKDAGKHHFDVAMTWAIDRLGRSLTDLLATIQTLETAGRDLFIAQQGIDTGTPAGRLLFQMTGAFAEFERGMIRERTLIGLARAKAAGKRLGRPEIPEAKVIAIRDALRAGNRGILKIAADLRVGSGTVQRIKREMIATSAAA